MPTWKLVPSAGEVAGEIALGAGENIVGRSVLQAGCSHQCEKALCSGHHVSRRQVCIDVSVDGVSLTNLGPNKTGVRQAGSEWQWLTKGTNVPLRHGDEIALDSGSVLRSSFFLFAESTPLVQLRAPIPLAEELILVRCPPGGALPDPSASNLTYYWTVEHIDDALKCVQDFARAGQYDTLHMLTTGERSNQVRAAATRKARSLNLVTHQSVAVENSKTDKYCIISKRFQ